jgi:hypothetical protein
VIKQALMPAIASLASVGLVATNLSGAGATFPAILCAQMFAGYINRTGVQVNDDPSGALVFHEPPGAARAFFGCCPAGFKHHPRSGLEVFVSQTVLPGSNNTV